jgi:trimethylamine--corrinoid protein Co-methyltransferase
MENEKNQLMLGPRGGSYKPLTDSDLKRIHSTALDVLENIGIAGPTPELLERVLPKGCIQGDDGRLKFPRSLVEEMIDISAKEYVVYAINPRNDYAVGGQHVYMSTSGQAVRILDFDTQDYRPSTLPDLYDAARLADQLENIHSYGQPFIATEYSNDLYVHDMNIAYAALAGTDKSISLDTINVSHLENMIEMFDIFLGKEGAFIERPFCTFGGCPILSPLTFAEENLRILIRVAELGLTGDVSIASQAGATAPAALAGALVQTFAETLACLCIVNIIRPGNPMNFGMWPFISDLRTGSFSGGSGEEALITAATTQLCNHYGLITSVPTGMTDSKTMDAQAGYENAITTTAAALAGGNMVSPYPGIVGSLMAQSFEGMVIDNDMMGNVLRLVRGIEVNDETLSYDVIKDVSTDSSHYLGHRQTMEMMRSEYVYPKLADRRTVDAWLEAGKETIYEQAHEKTKSMLSGYYPEYINTEIDAKIRSKFPIKLTPEDMKPGNGRW